MNTLPMFWRSLICAVVVALSFVTTGSRLGADEPAATKANGTPTIEQMQPVGDSPNALVTRKVIELKGTFPATSKRSLDGAPARLIDAGDLDGDGAGDAVIVFDEIDGDQKQRVVRAITSNGTSLWSKVAPVMFLEDDKTTSIMPAGLYSIPDLTGDGRRDICVLGENEGAFAVLNGASGQVHAVFVQRDPLYHSFGNVFPATGTNEDHLVFASLPNHQRKSESDQIGFSLLASSTFKQIVSFQHPFKRIASDSRFIGGGFVINKDGERTPILLACGKSKPSRRNGARTIIAAIYGRWFSRVRYAPIEFDILRPGAQVALFDSIAPQSRFPTMAVMLPGDEKEPTTVIVVNPDEDQPRWRWTEKDLLAMGPDYGSLKASANQGEPKSAAVSQVCAIQYLPANAERPKGTLAVAINGRVPFVHLIDLKTGKSQQSAVLDDSGDGGFLIGDMAVSEFRGRPSLVIALHHKEAATIRIVRVVELGN